MVSVREIRRQAVRKFRCPRCGKPVTQTITFTRTPSLFDVNASGRPKTTAGYRAELAAEARAWEQATELCDRCAGARTKVTT